MRVLIAALIAALFLATGARAAGEAPYASKALGGPAAIEGMDYARALAGLARYTLLLPEAERPAFARRWRLLLRDTRMLFSRYDGAGIPRYERQGDAYAPAGGEDVRLAGYLARAYGLVHQADRALADEESFGDVRAWSTGEPVKLLNHARATLSGGRFYDGNQVTPASQGAGLQHLDTLWQAWRVAGDEHKKAVARDKLWRFLGYTEPESAALAAEVDAGLRGYWQADHYAFSDGGTPEAADLAALIAGHGALAGLLRRGQDETAAVAASERQFRLARAAASAPLPATPGGLDLARALADLAVEGAPAGDPLGAAVEVRLAAAEAAKEAAPGALGAYLDAASALRRGRTPTPAMRAAAARLLAAWDNAPAARFLIPHPAPVVHRDSPPDWLILALIALAMGALLYGVLRFWPARWNRAVPATGGMLIATLAVSGFVGGTMKLSAHTSTTEFCGSCHVIKPKVDDMFNPKSRSLAAKHFWHEWIPANKLECYSCHSYGQGVRGVIASKLVGTKELLETVTGLYEEPIRPTQDLNPTCLQCHSRALDPTYINDPSHLLFAQQLASSRMQCSACHAFHPSNKDVKGEFTRPERLFQAEH